MSLNLVKDYVKSKIAPASDNNLNDKAIVNFIDDLHREDDVDSIRLLLCMGIDIKTSIKHLGTEDIESNSVIRTLRACITLARQKNISLKTIEHCPARLKFAVARREISPLYYKPCIVCDKNDEYVRVYNFRSYMLYVVDVNREVNTGITKIEDGNESMMRYKAVFESKRKYVKVNVTNLGRTNQWMFVADKRDVKSIGYQNPDKIVDALGLYSTNTAKGTKFVCVEYDSKFSEKTYQPDTMTGDWGNVEGGVEIAGNDFYLSYSKSDEYGRTYNMEGTDIYIKERIHREFFHNGSTIYSMLGRDLGTLEREISKGSNYNLIITAYKRFQNA